MKMVEEASSISCEVFEEYLGEKLGLLSFYQLSYENFNLSCLSKNIKASNSDSTGKRLYAGGHVGIRFFQNYSALFDCKSVVELGCGTGIVGLTTLMSSNMAYLLLTDGSEDTLQITNLNIARILSEKPIKVDKVSCQKLYWGKDEHIEEALQSLPLSHGRGFDLVIGCELMYYNTDIPSLVSTVLSLVEKETGMFFHCHLFRKLNQDLEMIKAFADYGWTTYEIEKDDFFSSQELLDHPEWYDIRMMVSGKEETLIEMSTSFSMKAGLFTGIYSLKSGIDVGENDSQAEENRTPTDLFLSVLDI
jgi:SAM-dependent methyltransferase